MNKIIIAACLTVMLVLLLVFGGCAVRDLPKTESTSAMQVIETLPFEPHEEATRFEFTDILGCSGYCLELTGPGEQVIRRYYQPEDSRDTLIAESFGFEGNGADYIIDIDGDGIRELVCNVVYGDGAERVFVYRYSAVGDRVEVGRIDRALFYEAGVVSRSVREEYDPAQRAVIVRFFTAQESAEELVWEWSSFDNFTFTAFSE